MLRVSYSQISLWNSCNYKWYLGYQEGWTPKREPSYFALGSAIHTHLNNYYSFLIENPGRWRDALAVSRFKMMETMAEISVQEMVQFGSAWKFFEAYVTDFASTADLNHKFIGSEKEYILQFQSVEGRPFEIVVLIDLEAINGGNHWIWDHKSFSKTPWSAKSTASSQQLKLYGYVRNYIGDPIAGVIINSINTYEYKDRASQPVDKLYKRIPVVCDKRELQNAFDELRLAVDDLAEKQERQIFRRNLNPYTCERCNFFEPCQMDIKGLDIMGYMRDNYKKKEDRNGPTPDTEFNQTSE